MVGLSNECHKVTLGSKYCDIFYVKVLLSEILFQYSSAIQKQFEKVLGKKKKKKLLTYNSQSRLWDLNLETLQMFYSSLPPSGGEERDYTDSLLATQPPYFTSFSSD